MATGRSTRCVASSLRRSNVMGVFVTLVAEPNYVKLVGLVISTMMVTMWLADYAATRALVWANDIAFADVVVKDVPCGVLGLVCSATSRCRSIVSLLIVSSPIARSLDDYRPVVSVVEFVATLLRASLLAWVKMVWHEPCATDCAWSLSRWLPTRFLARPATSSAAWATELFTRAIRWSDERFAAGLALAHEHSLKPIGLTRNAGGLQ